MNRFLGVIWISPVLVLLLCTNLFVTAAGLQPPKINFLEVGKKWENITGKPGAPPKGVNSMYSDTGDDLGISCIASYPIRWNISGTIVRNLIFSPVSINGAVKYICRCNWEILLLLYFGVSDPP